MVACLIGLAFWSMSWLVWAGLTVLMLIVFGPHHPRTADEGVPLDPTRKALAVFAVIMFILCFTPAPIEPMDIVTRGRSNSLESLGLFPPPSGNALMTWTMPGSLRWRAGGTRLPSPSCFPPSSARSSATPLTCDL